ncbi:hypothetical protein [Candidatus Bathycorpusculum sp.]|nr:hypothetical protein [Candidatus Termitimicrobium sp.]
MKWSVDLTGFIYQSDNAAVDLIFVLCGVWMVIFALRIVALLRVVTAL